MKSQTVTDKKQLTNKPGLKTIPIKAAAVENSYFRERMDLLGITDKINKISLHKTFGGDEPCCGN